MMVHHEDAVSAASELTADRTIEIVARWVRVHERNARLRARIGWFVEQAFVGVAEPDVHRPESIALQGGWSVGRLGSDARWGHGGQAQDAGERGGHTGHQATTIGCAH